MEKNENAVGNFCFVYGYVLLRKKYFQANILISFQLICIKENN